MKRNLNGFVVGLAALLLLPLGTKAETTTDTLEERSARMPIDLSALPADERYSAYSEWLGMEKALQEKKMEVEKERIQAQRDRSNNLRRTLSDLTIPIAIVAIIVAGIVLLVLFLVRGSNRRVQLKNELVTKMIDSNLFANGQPVGEEVLKALMPQRKTDKEQKSNSAGFIGIGLGLCIVSLLVHKEDFYVFIGIPGFVAFCWGTFRMVTLLILEAKERKQNSTKE